MESILSYILSSIVLSFLFAIPGVIFDAWLCKMGTVRDSKRILIIIVTLGFVFIKPSLPSLRGDISWWIYGIIIIVSTTLATHRSDIGEAMKHGNWWWKPKTKKKS